MPMKVFISWSGERSRQLALCLKNWLPKVIQSLQPWMSAEDIRAGGRWLLEIGTQPEETSFGVVCLKPENLKEPWILFEAGALGKMLRTASVCPYLLGVEPSTIAGPLAQFRSSRQPRSCRVSKRPIYSASPVATFAQYAARASRMRCAQPRSDASTKHASHTFAPRQGPAGEINGIARFSRQGDRQAPATVHFASRNVSKVFRDAEGVFCFCETCERRSTARAVVAPLAACSSRMTGGVCGAETSPSVAAASGSDSLR